MRRATRMRRSTPHQALFVLALFIILAVPEPSRAVPISPGTAVSIDQVDFEWELANVPNSNTGMLSIAVWDIRSATGLNEGFLNASTSVGWVIQNIPVFADEQSPYIITYFNLGSASGTNVTSLSMSMDFSAIPTVDFVGASPSIFGVGTTTYDAEGKGDPPDTAGVAPPAAGVTFETGGEMEKSLQHGHRMIETAKNQCGPAAVATSLDWLRSKCGTSVPHPHSEGLGADGSLVGAVELEMNRGFQDRRNGPPVHDSAFMNGKLRYLAKNGLRNLDVKHQSIAVPGDTTVTTPGPDGQLGTGDDITVTSKSQGAVPTAEFINSEIKKGEDVEIGWVWPRPPGGGHWVTCVGSGKCLNRPFIYWVHDRVQKSDALDPRGYREFSYLKDPDGDGFLNVVGHPSNPKIDIVVAESDLNCKSTKPLMGHKEHKQGKAAPTPPAGTRSWYLYPSACGDRYNGTWVPYTTPAADSLNSYLPFTAWPYWLWDHSIGDGPGKGELWRMVPGNTIPTADRCNPQKNSGADMIFHGVEPTTHFTIPGQFNSLGTCTFPVPSGVGTIIAQWTGYNIAPQGSGYVRYTEYRVFRGGFWEGWRVAAPSRTAHAGETNEWADDGALLTDAVEADSVQLRYTLECVPSLATNQNDCGNVLYGALYDNFSLLAVTGVPKPVVGIYVGGVAQTTFVDGTMAGLNCSTVPCWPGIRGTALGPGAGVDDNFNTPLGDSIVVSLESSRRRNGMGINWHYGHDGATLRSNGAFRSDQPSCDAPRAIFRVYDPATQTWSPFDSTELDANALQVTDTDTLVLSNEYRFDWPPRDRVAAGATLPGGFTIGGFSWGAPTRSAYADLAFLPHGTRIQYYIKAVDAACGVTYQFSSDAAANEVEDLPFLPGSSVRAPDIIEFSVLPGVYPPGPPGSLLAGRTDTPILNLDGAYTAWSYDQDPVTSTLRALGVRADRYRYLQGFETAHNVGGHELDGGRVHLPTNYWPNMDEYGIKDSLGAWYRIFFQSSHARNWPVMGESDSRLVREWWLSDTGLDGGDRCIFASGDDFFTSLRTTGHLPNPERSLLAEEVFGVVGTSPSWPGIALLPYPSIDDRFANPSSGPAPSTGYSYPADGGCPGLKRFDTLTKASSSDHGSAAFYPLFSGTTETAAISTLSERDAVPDRDGTKSLGYGYSFQYVRKPNLNPGASNFARSGLEERMRILYKFLTGCRGARSAAAGDTAKCWPCPTDAAVTGEWGTLTGFQTGTYGPLYPIQAQLLVTSVTEGPAPNLAPKVNALSQNRPNPFNPETTIPFSLAQGGHVAIRIYDVRGRLIRSLLHAHLPAGWHEVRWNGRNSEDGEVASGLYFYQITYPDGAKFARKLTLLR